MMRPEDIAITILQTLETHPNYHVVDVEVRPLMPKGKPQLNSIKFEVFGV